MKCLNCGKEIPEGRKFCSSSCSAKYNNVRRQRKPWTEEQRKAIQTRVEQICKYCGKPTGKFVQLGKKEGVCEDCKPFVPRLKTIRALGWTKGSLKEGYFQTLQKIEEEYRNGESTATLSLKYGLDDIVFQKYLKHVRSRSESRQNALCLGRSTVNVAPQYENGTHISWDGKEFHYRSSWEREYMELLDTQKIQYEYEPFGIKYWDSEKQKNRVAFPDFYLPETMELVEIKSSWTIRGKLQELKDKFSRYRELGYTPVLLLDKQKQDIEKLNAEVYQLAR